MRRLIGIFIIFLLIFISVKGTYAQPIQDKKFEFSTSASMWNIKFEWNDEATTIFNMPLRIGFFAYKGIEIEPEVLLTIPEDGDGTGIHVLANVSYNLKASKKTIVFFLGGYGFGNASPIYTVAWDEDESITAWNFGAGIKYLVNSSAAIRLEYRYTRYSDEQGEHFRTDNNFYLGVSIFF
ncbi:MAG: outer membrane beta-barrel protein [Candidatus Aminicenantes bacterium]|nr:outer membrane beta-barrel protein [Candidatus Aminicenantes bacterium]